MNGGFDLDGDGCLVDVNRLSEDHGRRLHAEAIKFRAAYPAATFSFLDYYNAYTYILRNKAAFGTMLITTFFLFPEFYTSICERGGGALRLPTDVQVFTS
jgi:hypothetical protein